MTATTRDRTVSAISDRTNAIALAIRCGAVGKLEEWAGRPDPDPRAGEHVPTDPATGAVVLTEDDGNPIDYADPTGELAASRSDIHGWALREIDRILTHVAFELEEVSDHLRMGLSSRQAEEVKASLPAACQSCARLTDHQDRTLYSPVHARGLCHWCNDFDREWHQRPPKTILRAHHDGRRITRRMIERALVAQKQPAEAR